MTITREWDHAIHDYLLALAAEGKTRASVNSLRQRVEHMARRIGTDPWEVTSEQLIEWAGAQDWATETRRGRYNAYRSFWGWARRTKRCRHNPAKGLARVKPGEPDPRPVPDRIYRKALLRADERERLWLELAHDYGLRRCEVAVVHSSDLVEDLLGWSLLVHGKGGKRRMMPLMDGTARRLRDLPAGYAFPGNDDGHLSPRWIGKRVAELLDGDWTMHKLRHSAGTRFYLNGDLPIAQKLLGHASPATTLIYVKVPDDRLRATVMAAAS